MVQRCDCILLAEYRSRHPSSSSDIITEVFDAFRLIHIDKVTVKKTITNMVQQGSYYRSLEKALGSGSTLALGTTISETKYENKANTL